MKKYYHIRNKSFDELDVGSFKDLWEKLNKDYDGITADVFTKFETQEKGFKVIMSSPKEDRHGDVVHQTFDTKAFKGNPVVLDSHNYDSIEHIVGKVNKIGKTDGKLSGDIEFMLDNPKGLLAHKMAEQGFLNAVSIGFIPLEFNGKGEISKSELLELSVVTVPAQAEALFEKLVKSIEEEAEVETEETEEETEEVIGINELEEDEEPEVEEEPEDEPEEETKSKSELCKEILKELQKMREDNFVQKKRKIYQSVRDILSQDN
jgi:hypothetical protein